MKKLAYALLVLFALSAIKMHAEPRCASQKINHKKVFAPKGGKDKWKCDDCKSRCSLHCLKSEKCNLTFDLLVNSNNVSLSGNFQVTIVAPNGETVSTSIINAGTIGTPSDFFMIVPSPICSGFYKVNITNLDAQINIERAGNQAVPPAFNPFEMITVTNSCNSKCVQFVFPTEEQSGVSFSQGCSLQAVINIRPNFVHFEKCDDHCKCEEKSDG